MMNNVLCPLTGQNNIERVDSIETQRLMVDWNKSYNIDITKELEGITNIDLYRCNETGLRFFMPVSAAGSENLYAQLQKFDWFYMPWKWEHEVLFSRLNKGEKILEVGCATGAFIEKLCTNGFDAEGIEFNSAAVAEAQEKKLPVTSIDLLSLSSNKPAAYDVVCSFQVLEHVSEPGDFINNCIALLKSNGRLVLCVPNHESFLKYQYNLLDMPPHHMTQWSVDTFKALEKLYPLRLTFVRFEPLARYHVVGFIWAHRKRLVAKNSIYRWLLNRYTIPILQIALQLGLYRFMRGQSIYVELIKL